MRRPPPDCLDSLLLNGVESLRIDDPDLHRALVTELARQGDRLTLVASSSLVDPSVLACQASVAVNVTAEGYPGRRYHAGCEVVDELERLAILRARAVFGARYANVQPHSATTANQIVLFTLLRPGDTVLGMELHQGGHLSHGAKPSFSGTLFDAVGYGLDADGAIDYAQVATLAHQRRPRVIICGATAYSRQVDFARFRAIADEVGAWLLADISHIGGLVAAGLHPSPIDHAHITTTCTHKQLFGPRGGLILIGRDADTPGPDGKRTLAETFDRAVFPFFQGAPILNAIAAKARALDLVSRPAFRATAQRIIADAARLAHELGALGYRIVSGRSENHTVLIDLRGRAVSGLVAERALEEAHIVVNKNRIPGDDRPAVVTSGIRIGTNGIAYRNYSPDDMPEVAALIHRVLSSLDVVDDRHYTLPDTTREAVRRAVSDLCHRHPIPGYGDHRVQAQGVGP